MMASHLRKYDKCRYDALEDYAAFVLLLDTIY